MKSKQLAFIGILILASSLTAFGQSTVDPNGVYRPTEEEVAASKRLQELLRHPTFMSLRLVSAPRDVPRESSTDTPAPYKVKDYIGFELFISQNSIETFTLTNYLSPYYEYRPELIRDGEVIAYKKQAQQSVAQADDHPPSGSIIPVRLTPNVDHQWSGVKIDDWYEPLGVGRYQLTVKKRFTWGGDWVVSNPVYFEVQPRTAKPIPEGVSIELVPEGLQPQKDGPYQVTSDVAVVMFVVNNSDQPVKRNVIDREYGNQPQLFRDGVLIPYCEEMVQRIRAKEENPRLIEITNDVFLEPKMRSWGHGISLKDWYGLLPPGSYRLVNRQRFEIAGPWTAESAPLLFEVLPVKQN